MTLGYRSEILTSLHGRRLGLTADGYLAGDGFKGPLVGPNGANYRPGGNPAVGPHLFDDFLGTTLSTRWTAITGNDAQAIAAAQVAGALGGQVAMTSGNSNPGVTAADAAGLVGAANWKASQGNLVVEARVKLDDITLVKAFVGFTDNIALEFPVISNGTTGITATADDAVGFLFDTLATTDVWSACAVKATVSGGVVVNGAAPVADTFETLRVEVDSLGNAYFFQNGAYVGTFAAAITTTVALNPIIIVMENGVAAVRKLTADWVYVAADR